MKKLLITTLFLLIAGFSANAQTTVTGKIVVATSTAKPVTCAPGDVMTAVDNFTLYVCGPINIWTSVPSGGGGTTWASLVGGTNNFSSFICGTGCSISATGSGTITATNVSAGAVTSFTGDGGFSNNSLSTGAVTLALVQPTAHKYWGNNTGSTSAPGYVTIVAADLPATSVNSVNNDTNVTGSISGQALTLGWTGTLAAARLNSNVVQAITNDTNITGSITAQNLTLGWTGTLAKGRNLATAVYTDQSNTFSTGTQDFSGVTLFKARVGSGLTTSANGDIGYDSSNSNWHIWNGADKIIGAVSGSITNGDCAQFSISSGKVQLVDSAAGCGSGSGFANPMTTLGDLIYGGASGTATRLGGPTTPNGVAQYLISTPSAGVATAPTWSFEGVPLDAQSGSTYTIAAADRTSLVQTTNNTTSTAVTIPQAGTTSFGNNMAFVHCNTGSVVATDTPTTSTVNGNATVKLVGAVAGQNPECAFYWSDNTNYWAAEILPTDSNGRLQAAGMPALTGDVTNTAGTLATTVSKINGTSFPTSATLIGSNGSAQPIAAALTSANVFVGNGSNLPVGVAVSGDATITNAGVVTVSKINNTSFAGTNGDVVSFGAANIPADSGFLATNVVRKDAANTMGASGTIDGSGMATTAGMKVPVGAGAVPTADGAIANNSTIHALVSGSNGTTIVQAAAATGTTVSTTCTNQFVTVISAVAAPTCTSVTLASAQFANQGTTTTVLHGNAAGNPAFSAVVGADMTNNTVTATQLAAQYSKGSCTELWGGSGTSFALTAGDDAISNNSCYNDSGVTRTITAVKCRSDNGSNTTTVNPTFGAAGTGTTILSGALTCGNSYAYSSTGTVSNASWTTGTGITPAMSGTLTGTSIAMIVEYTF